MLGYLNLKTKLRKLDTILGFKRGGPLEEVVYSVGWAVQKLELREARNIMLSFLVL